MLTRDDDRYLFREKLTKSTRARIRLYKFYCNMNVAEPENFRERSWVIFSKIFGGKNDLVY